jgi:hypothetical protein
LSEKNDDKQLIINQRNKEISRPIIDHLKEPIEKHVLFNPKRVSKKRRFVLR